MAASGGAFVPAAPPVHRRSLKRNLPAADGANGAAEDAQTGDLTTGGGASVAGSGSLPSAQPPKRPRQEASTAPFGGASFIPVASPMHRPSLKRKLPAADVVNGTAENAQTGDLTTGGGTPPPR